MLNDSVPNIIFERLITIRDEIIDKEMLKVEQGHNGKLYNLRTVQQNKYNCQQLSTGSPITDSSGRRLVIDEQPVVKEVVKSITNLSQRPLSEEEGNVLKHGLHHVYPTGKFDASRFICNMEYFYARSINLHTDYRHYEQKDAKQQVVHQLSSIQLHAATQLRSIASSFQRKAEQEMKLNNQEFQHVDRTLKSLRLDQSIIITKPDKGRGIVIMDKSDYIRKMQSILQDEATFKCIDHDPTLLNEDRLIRLLLRLKKEGFITNDEYSLARPVGSRAARLYGLPKIHKSDQNYPLRPVMSAIKTVGYGLGRMLQNRLSHLQKSPYVIKDSFDFLNKIKSSKNVSKTMISFDVVSLFTCVPLTFTIDYILDQMYPTCSKICLHLPRTRQCVKCQQRIDFETLLRTATSDTHFTFDNKMYVQHNGVAMGAPLAPVMADIFMVHLETTLMDRLIQQGVCEWYRYVDDTFVLVNSITDVVNILAILNDFHASIKFTHKAESDNKLEFLDVQVIRQSEQQCFETTIYRKPTFTGLLTNWNSYVPLGYKKAGIVGMVDRALNICSTYTLLNVELDQIRRIGVNNDYPITFIDKIIGIKLSKQAKEIDEITKEPTIGCDKKQIYVEIPFIRSSTLELKKKITHLSNKLRPDLDIQFFCKPPPPTKAYFQTKDPIVKYMQSDVVYAIKCNDCGHSYIGKTERQCIRRLCEHGAPKTTFQQQQCNHEEKEKDDLNNNNNNNNNVVAELRRSSRLKEKAAVTTTAIKTTTTTKAPLLDHDKGIVLSSIKQHEKETGHHMDWSNFQVVWQDNHPYRLLIKESLLIQAFEPELNKTTHSVPLVVFPDGLPRVLLPNPDRR